MADAATSATQQHDTHGFDQGVVRALDEERLRLHRLGTPTSVVASLVAATLLLMLLWGEAQRTALLAWYGAVWAAMLLRLVVLHGHRKASPSVAAGVWLRKYRTAFFVHGLAWLGLVPVLDALPLHDGLEAAAFVITAILGGALVASAFDLRAPALFVLPAAVPLVLRLSGFSGDPAPSLAVIAVVFVAVMWVTARRTAMMTYRQVVADQQAQERFAQAQRHAMDAEAARRDLAQAHERTEQLLRGTRQGYWFVDPQGRTLDVNPAMCMLLGRTREQVLGRPASDFFLGPERAVLEAELALRRAGKASGYEIDIVRPDGSRLHAFNHATPIYGADGNLVGSIGLWTDLSPQKTLELELRTYERVTNSVTDIVSVVDAERRYRLVNDAWCHAVGMSRQDAIGRCAGFQGAGLWSPERLAVLEACFATGDVGTLTSSTLVAEGHQAVLQTRLYPCRTDTGRIDSVILVTRDITEQEQGRHDLEVSAEHLRRTLDATGDAIFAADTENPHEPVRFANPQMMNLWGLASTRPESLTPAQILQALCEQVVDADAEMAQVRAIIAANAKYEDHLRLRDGRVFFRRFEPAEVGGKRLRVWSFRDITAEERVLTLLQTQEAQQRALLDAFPGYIARLDRSGHYTYVNRSLEQVGGFAAGSLLGQPLEVAMGFKAASQIRALMPQVLAGQRADLEQVFARPQGSMTLQITLACGVDRASAEPVLYAFASDITGVRQAEQALRASEREVRALLEAFPGYIAAIDAADRYTYVNDRVAALFGQAAESIKGCSVMSVLGEERWRSLQAQLEGARKGDLMRFERHYPATATRHGLDLEVTHVAGTVGPEGRQVVYAFGQDITERKRAQASLAAARDEAERANKAKSQFLSHMSHELRTPLNAIVGFAHLLRRDTRPVLAEHQRGYVQQITKGADHLLALINEVLDLARIEAGRLVLETGPVVLEGVVSDALAFVREIAQDRGVSLQPAMGLEPLAMNDPGPVVLADRTRLRQVLLNLLSNAIKYNRPGGQVQVACLCEPEHLVIEVRDTGLGIEAHALGKLFKPFERLGADRGPIEGTGIGLVLCQRLVHAMQGEIGVRSQLGVGSVFWVRLPAVAGASTSVEPGNGALATRHSRQDAAAGHRDTPQTTVLYIDDNEVNVLLVETMLSDVPWLRVVSTCKPVDGLALALELQPNLVLLDIHMPELDGYQVLARLRADPATAHLPVVAVSADAMPSDLDVAQAAGFAAYLTKPLNFERLLHTVQQLSQPRQNPIAADL